MSYSTDQIKQLAKSKPHELITILSASIKDIQLLTNGIEILSEENIDEKCFLPILRKLLNHVHVHVRESAIIAITNYYDNKELPIDILNKLKNIAKSDPSNDLRDFASDLLIKN